MPFKLHSDLERDGIPVGFNRITPEGISITIDANAWQRPQVFDWLQELGSVETDEMYRVFNMGIGLALIVSPFYADSIRRMLTENGYENWLIGNVASGEKSVVVNNR